MKIIYDVKEWNSILKDKFRSFYYSTCNYNYFHLYAKYFNCKPECIFWEDNVLKIFWPHLIRKISDITTFRDFNYYDITSPYGHHGPLIIIKNGDINKSIKKFLELYNNFAIKNRYICEFIRFHPIYENWKFFTRFFDVVHVNDMVIVDLEDHIDEIWRNIDRNTRRYIRMAQKEFEEVIVTDKPTDDEIKTFFSLYHETMKRNNASQKYFFHYNFIKDHFRLIKSSLIYCRNKANETGASSIFLRDANVLHAHLASTNYRFKCSPFRSVLWEAIKWGKTMGLDYIYLGGGRVKNDSLFRFKKSFSKSIRPLYIGKLFFDMKTYDKLVSMNPKTDRENDYFPLYRHGLDENVV